MWEHLPFSGVTTHPAHYTPYFYFGAGLTILALCFGLLAVWLRFSDHPNISRKKSEPALPQNQQS
jgi:hypothetical protein